MGAAVVKRRPLSIEEQLMYTRLTHACVLSSFTRFLGRRGATDAMAIHGGAALHLFHGLQRRSSDMDFVVDRSRLNLVLPAVAAAVTELQTWFDGRMEAHVAASGRTKADGEVTRYKIAISLPQVIGAIHVHMEFWPVEQDCVLNYGMRSERVGAGEWSFPVRIRAPGVAAAAADKIIAVLARNHLKWRDIYDLWHLHRNCGARLLMPAIMKVLPAHLKAYESMTQQEVLGKIAGFLDIDRVSLLEMAKTDLLSYLDGKQRALAERMGGVMLGDAVRVARLCMSTLYTEMLSDLKLDPNGVPREDWLAPGSVARKAVPGMMLALVWWQDPPFFTLDDWLLGRAADYLERARSFLA